jgi:chemotaxis protein methyltransferase CheR
LNAVVELLLADFGLDPTRGGMLGTLTAHIESRLTQLGIGEAKFLERLRSDADERHRLIHAVTVRHSWFYRDPGQLDGLLQRMHMRQLALPARRPLDVWVAGCAAGEEAWTIAMLAMDAGISLRLRATDVDAFAIRQAMAAEYGAWTLRDLPERLQRFIEPCGDNRWRICDELRALDIEFAQHNLCDPPLPEQFDVICCRNVVIYFRAERAQAVVDGLRSTLRPGGELMLGAGDLLFRTDGRVRAPTPMTALPRPRAVAPVFEPAPLERRIEPIARPPIEPIDPDPRVTTVEASSPARSSDRLYQLGQLDRLGIAARAVDAGEYEPALRQLAEILDADPLDAEAHLWTGIAHYSLGNGSQAAEALRRARCLAPQLWPATLFAALTHERRGHWSAAVRCWASLERAVLASDAPLVEGTVVLLDALPRWRAEALALARQRISKHAESRSDD